MPREPQELRSAISHKDIPNQISEGDAAKINPNLWMMSATYAFYPNVVKKAEEFLGKGLEGKRITNCSSP